MTERTPEQLDEILGLLKSVLSTDMGKQLRIGQLISNLAMSYDIYYMPDTEFRERLLISKAAAIGMLLG